MKVISDKETHWLSNNYMYDKTKCIPSLYVVKVKVYIEHQYGFIIIIITMIKMMAMMMTTTTMETTIERIR